MLGAWAVARRVSDEGLVGDDAGWGCGGDRAAEVGVWNVGEDFVRGGG